MDRLRTPTTPEGLRRFDGRLAEELAQAAWLELGIHPTWHEMCRAHVRESMPLLARALDRLAAEKLGETKNKT